MSRTYRKHIEDHAHAWGNIYHWKEWWKIKTPYGYGYAWIHVVNKKARDEKPWGNPPKWFKQMKRRNERAKIKDAMRNEKYESIPHFKHSDRWDWT